MLLKECKYSIKKVNYGQLYDIVMDISVLEKHAFEGMYICCCV